MLLDIKERQNGQTGFLRQQDADPVPGSERVLLPSRLRSGVGLFVLPGIDEDPGCRFHKCPAVTGCFGVHCSPAGPGERICFLGAFSFFVFLSYSSDGVIFFNPFLWVSPFRLIPTSCWMAGDAASALFSREEEGGCGMDVKHPEIGLRNGVRRNGRLFPAWIRAQSCKAVSGSILVCSLAGWSEKVCGGG